MIYHTGLLKIIGSGDKSRSGENSTIEHTLVRTPQSPLTRVDLAGTHHNVTAREPYFKIRRVTVITADRIQSKNQ